MKNPVFKFTLFTMIACASCFSRAQSIRIDDTFTANQLVQNVLTNSACIATQNANATGDDFSGSKKSYAYFNANGSNFPFQEGVILSTSSSQNAAGPYTNSEGEGDLRWLGDRDLQIALGRNNTINATVLEFDFTALTNTISFNYLFASNEYQLYFPCEFSDGFAFLIKEVGSTEPYRNIATIPNTTVPVSSTNIRPFTPAFNNGVISKPSCDAMNQEYFAGFNSTASPINYSAQTVILKAKTSVVAGRNYHIKLVIADDSNELFDSAVFIEAGSFQPQINLGPEQTICNGESVVLDTGFSDLRYQYQWFKDGSTLPIAGANNPTFQATDAGEYAAKVTLNGSGINACIATGNTKITYKPALRTTLMQCGDSGNQAFFDLSSATSDLRISESSIMTFYETFADYQQKRNPITNLKNYYSSTTIIHASIASPQGSCQDYAAVQLSVLPLDSNLPIVVLCDNDSNQDGSMTFNLEKVLNPKISPSTVGVSSDLTYYYNQDDAALQSNQLKGNFTTTTNPQTLYVRVENNSNCSGVYKITLEIQPYTNTTINVIENITVNDFSNNNSATINTIATGNYEYSIDGITFQSSATFSSLSAGKYVAYVRDIENCTIDSRQFIVLDYPKFFTPNGDGFNDTWSIKNLDLYPKANLSIFDRYGKLLREVSGINATWNGIYNGQLLPANDYWFRLVLDQDNIIKGHFSLKR
ncbi:T9SS type B sorting domain-containing protein [Flavobacterium sp. F-328]|uniref:T9SS type B sorting domain-containing protein n=1 Tax=Flavobacterium erciyesense TaxID=2825842 RepID=A0ABS5D266_9FLAO|nr:choice-of-anchor L domain-containing protein [Flavobacterium erciyesense]MBQ0908122.1 T9SS type B sorting domain-containing protein [Flavobacterium erciyesense]